MTGELARLIEVAAQANNGRSQRQAAEMAARKGAPISKSTIAKVIAGQYETITAQMVRGIAAGYNISEDDVLRAMAADMGFTIHSYDPSPESALRRDPSLNADVKAVLLAGLSAARHRKTGSDDTELEDWGILGGEAITDREENST
jgi:transcriptional regulator with XRE-family HTH domain